MENGKWKIKQMGSKLLLGRLSIRDPNTFNIILITELFHDKFTCQVPSMTALINWQVPQLCMPTVQPRQEEKKNL